ncbi:hypothetical protein [Spirillospora sp. CA-294931]|uniref:hypothetical protein n=1 Tax=Spirillospora sp. CA-294931 TaxID=3240042 RepID=UPI003D8F173E
MTETQPDRRRVLRGTGAAALGAGLVGLGAAVPARAEDGKPDALADPVGTWRGTVTMADQTEVALFTFHPGGIFTSFAEGIHIATGRWEALDEFTVRFSLWQVLPSDLQEGPHKYNGEVQAMHMGRVVGQDLLSEGTGRLIDINGREISRGVVRTRLKRYGLKLF